MLCRWLCVWLGMTAEEQKHFDQRWKHLQKIPVLVKGTSKNSRLSQFVRV
jgi:hypothetical protein